MNTDLSKNYVKAKYGNPSFLELTELQNQAIAELQEIEIAKNDIYKRFAGIHGRFQQSQLDVLDIREQKTSAILQNVKMMLAKPRQ